MRSKTAPARTGHRETADTSGPVSAGRGALLVSTAGLLVAAYLTYEHLTAAASLACPDTGAINCVKVTTSSYSQFLGAPVAVLGLGYFAVMTGLCLPRPWRSPRLALARLRLLLAGAGVLFVVYLIWAELFRINAICVWCTVVHALTLALFAILTVGHALRDTKPTPTEAPQVTICPDRLAALELAATRQPPQPHPRRVTEFGDAETGVDQQQPARALW